MPQMGVDDVLRFRGGGGPRIVASFCFASLHRHTRRPGRQSRHPVYSCRNEREMILRPMFWIGIMCLVACFARADTEIRNFKLPLSTIPSSLVPENTNLERVTTGVQTLKVSSETPELWLSWASGPKDKGTSWTARISWAGSVCLCLCLCPCAFSSHLLSCMPTLESS